MKTKRKKDYQKFVNEVKLLCKKHGIFMVGTCETEGIFGEISLGDIKNIDKFGWQEAKNQLNNKVLSYYIDDFTVEGIGEII